MHDDLSFAIDACAFGVEENPVHRTARSHAQVKADDATDGNFAAFRLGFLGCGRSFVIPDGGRLPAKRNVYSATYRKVNVSSPFFVTTAISNEPVDNHHV
jgi:hypothetical protein